MQTILVLFALLVLFTVLKPLVRMLIAFFAARSLGDKALGKLPDTIHLTAAGTEAWSDTIVARRLASELARRGFEDAGTYTVPELPGLTLELMLHPLERILGVLYEHPANGLWVELITRYTDGTVYQVSSSKETGLDARPGHKTIHLPAATPDMRHKRLLSGRTDANAEPVSAQEVIALFEHEYAEGVAWRKAQGVSRSEMVKVAKRKAA